MKKSIKYIVLLTVLNHTQLIKSLETVPNPTSVASATSPGAVHIVNPVTIAVDSISAHTRTSHKPRSLNRIATFELPTLPFTHAKKATATPAQATVVEWDSAAPAGRPRRASSFSDLRELAESTQARHTPTVNRSMRVMLVPEPIDLSADSCVIEIGDPHLAESKATRTTPKLTRTASTRLSNTLELVSASESTARASSITHDPLVLALAASLKIYTEQNSEFLRNQAEQNKVAAEERNTTRRGVRDAKIIGAIATVGTLVGPYVAPYITTWVKSWI